MIKKCLVCNKEFSSRPSANQVYCSKKCHASTRLKTKNVECTRCGKKFKRQLWWLKRAKTIYCSKECHDEDQREGMSPFNMLYVDLVRRGKRRNDPDPDFDVYYLDELYEKQNGKCAISGLDLIVKSRSDRRRIKRNGKKWKKSPYAASVDRIDIDKPYSKDNIQLVCMCINYMKNDFDNNQIVEILESIKTV